MALDSGEQALFYMLGFPSNRLESQRSWEGEHREGLLGALSRAHETTKLSDVFYKKILGNESDSVLKIGSRHFSPTAFKATVLKVILPFQI